MKKRIAINGFGRIGRLTYKILSTNPDVEVVAINDLTDNKTLAHLLQFDSSHGKFNAKIKSDDHFIWVNNHKIATFSEKDPRNLPWEELKIDTVIECTGIFRNAEKMSYHLEAGAKKVLLSAPAEGEGISTIVIGVNDKEIDPSVSLYSNASCTTNCLVPFMKVIIDQFGFLNGSMVTIHAYTQDQNLQDAPHKDLRRARAAAMNIVPTTTGAAKSGSIVLPELKGKMTAMSYRVPVITGSLIEVNCRLNKPTTTEALNQAFKDAAEGYLKGVLHYSTDELVSTDIIGSPFSSILDSKLTLAHLDQIKVVAWYDNESGYSNRLAELAAKL
jgi:glyceraldehyde 3-phosphate dehydrogenase